MLGAAPQSLPFRDPNVARAVVLSRLTIAYNVVEAVLAVPLGVADESLALLGFGLDSLIEVASAGLVLWRFSVPADARSALEARERKATLGIGLLFCLLALVTVVGALWRLWTRQAPETTLAGIVISTASLSFMVYLWRAKKRVAVALDSSTMASDAACSLACIQLSVVLLAGSLLFAVAPALWWADAMAALGLAALIAREGVEMVRASRKPEFSGGCGCRTSCD